MICELKPYPAYKDSGIHLLGEVPEHWEVRRLRSVAGMRVSNVDKHSNDSEIPIRLCNYVDVYKHDYISADLPFMQATASFDEISRFRLESGDVLITKDSEVWNDIAVPALVVQSADDLVCGYHLALLRPVRSHLEGGYLFRALQSAGVSHQFHVEATGVTRYGLSHGAIKSIQVPLPPLPEQAAIVRFLDYVDRRIRRHIRAKQKLIALLEEQKQAIIHRAVTGQIDVRTGQPYPAYKPSGVQWLGDVPKHWEVRRNGAIFVQRNESGYPNLPILEVSLKTGVRIRDFENSDRKQVMSDRDKYKRAISGDIAYNIMRMWQGAVGVVPTTGLISPAYIVARPLAGTDPRYFVLLFRTAVYMTEIDKYSRGIVKDRNRLYWEDFKRMPSCYPPHPEQVMIADVIDRATNAINTAVSSIRSEIALLTEYRSRLISDVVTGRFDVREAATRLPVEPAEPEPIEEADALPGDIGEVPDELDLAVEEAAV